MPEGLPTERITMKTALLIPVLDTHTMAQQWIWETPSEHKLSQFYDTKEQALQNSPKGFLLLNDGYRPI